MKKTRSIVAVFAALILSGASAVRAQTPAQNPGPLPMPADEGPFVNISAGGAPQTRSFTTSNTFTAFSEPGSAETNQSIGKQFLFDATAGYGFGHHLAFAVGIWTSNGKSAAASTVLMPDPLFFGRFTTVNLSASDLKQRNVGVNLQLVWTLALTDRLDIALSGGPTIIHTKQDLAAATVPTGSGSPALIVTSESKTTAKAGNAGVDLAFHITPRYGIGGFVRYAGGKVDLPSKSNLSVGGVQLGAGLRFRF